MYIIRLCVVIAILPVAWVATIRYRKLPFQERYAKIHRWSLRVFHLLHVPLHVTQKAPLPNDVPLFFVSNHQGTFDPLILVAGIQTPMTFVSKKENQRIPFISSFSKTLELIYFDREDTGSAVHMLRESARYLKRKQNLLIFPEGTRSKGKQMLPMKDGAIQPAYLGKAMIVPVTQVNTYDMWTAIRKREEIALVIHEPIPYENYRKIKREELCHQIQQIIEQEL